MNNQIIEIEHIEEKFMETFNINNCDIDTKRQCSKYKSIECYYCDNKYPEITSDILLKLICILNKFELQGLPNDYQHAKKQVLNGCIEFAECYYECACVTKEERDEFKKQIQEVFQ